MPGPVTDTALPPVLLSASKYGLGAVLAVFLVYKLADSFEKRLDAQSAKIDAVAAQLTDQAQRDAVHILLLKAICANTATTESERAVCREAGR